MTKVQITKLALLLSVMSYGHGFAGAFLARMGEGQLAIWAEVVAVVMGLIGVCLLILKNRASDPPVP
jgi:hypothetical protein